MADKAPRCQRRESTAKLHLRTSRVVIATCHDRRIVVRVGRIALLLMVCLAGRAAEATIIRFETVMGNIDVRMYDTAMPRTVTNFLHYVNAGKFNGSVVHRNSDTPDPPPSGPLRDFVIQGGGYYLSNPTPPNTVMSTQSVATIAPIADEPGGGVTGLSNLRGTIAMAKSGINTATSQWFINQGNNSFLDSPLRSDGGFAAFGRVLGSGMTVVDAIGDLPLPADFGFGIGSPFNDLPLRNFSGNSITQVRVQHTVTVTKVSVLSLAAGDFNRDGFVNNADYSLWKADFGSKTKVDADGNGNGRVDAADYSIWRDSLAQTGGGNAAAAFDSLSVPEPGGLLLAAMIGALAPATRRRGISC